MTQRKERRKAVNALATCGCNCIVLSFLLSFFSLLFFIYLSNCTVVVVVCVFFFSLLLSSYPFCLLFLLLFQYCFESCSSPVTFGHHPWFPRDSTGKKAEPTSL
uniref:Uncharacterized protein n=1 Tax=Trypanosoma vivax (strain Y486) TaxID=1055687 RepID=G0U1U2_TRYVY|nr:hypothetical protein TVY486_0900640 [Trypanosoma vivax Y486]